MINLNFFKKIKALIIKELIVLLKDPKSRFSLISPPLIQLLLFSSVATLDVYNTKLAILNYDSGSASKEIITSIANSKTYFSSIENVYDYSEIEEKINKQKVIGAIIFNSDFSQKINSNQEAKIQIIFDGRRLNSASIVSSYLSSIIENSIFEETKFELKNIHQNQITTELNSRNWFNPNLNYKWFIIPSLMALILSTSILSVSALSIAKEREVGTFDQLVVSPLSPTEIIMGKIGANILIGLVQGIVIFFIIASFIPFNGNIIYIFMGIILYLISLVSVGLLISSLSSNQQQATIGSFFYLIPVILTSGFSSPFINMTIWLQKLSDFINPIHHFVVIVQMVFNKGVSFDLLYFNFSMLLIFSLTSLFLSVWFFRRRVL
jgi:ABC-2 type transport system permease protein